MLHLHSAEGSGLWHPAVHGSSAFHDALAPRPEPARLGLRTLASVLAAAVLFPVLLVASAGECGQHGLDQARIERSARAGELLQQVREAVSAYPFAGLVDASTGRRWAAAHSGSGLRLDVGVTRVRADLVRVEAAVVDEVTRGRLGHFVTWRMGG